MQNVEFGVKWSEKAENSIISIMNYISDRGSPENAITFFNKLEAFGNSLAILPSKFLVCRQSRLARYNYRCAVFHENYIFVYRITKTAVIIINVVHASLLN
ncbi:MAG: type II toxin-antitoxin system RelE/ParE family toxin [Bacteroidia bacterium]|nr:type II toxin-antitoxin system RelE/ParE family toxin [Bacteroidia bacterium]